MKNLFFLLFSLLLTACSSTNGEQVTHSSELIVKTLSNPEFLWIETLTDDFNIYSLDNSHASENIEKLKTGLTASSATILDRFSLIKPREKPTVFFINSRTQMQELVGHSSGGWAAVRDNAVFYVYNSKSNPQLKHELGHLYTWTNWGDPYHYWLSEGMAVLSSGSCRNENFHTWAAYLDRTKKITPIEDLELKPFDFSKVEPHLQAASLLYFIEERFGLEVLKETWKKGLIKWGKENAMNIIQIEEAWLLHLRSPEFNKKSLQLEKPFFCE